MQLLFLLFCCDFNLSFASSSFSYTTAEWFENIETSRISNTPNDVEIFFYRDWYRIIKSKWMKSATVHTTFNDFLRHTCEALKDGCYLLLVSSPTSSWPICIFQTRDTSRSKFSDSRCLCSVAYIWRAKRNPIIFIAIFQCFWGFVLSFSPSWFSQKRKNCHGMLNHGSREAGKQKKALLTSLHTI